MSKRFHTPVSSSSSRLPTKEHHMRRWILALAASLPMMACEDGPHQVYNPAPPGAANQWNDGNTPGTVNGASAPFAGAGSAGGGGTNKSEICNAPTKESIWLNMIKQPIKPSRFVGLMDLAGGDSWPGLTIEQAEGT